MQANQQDRSTPSNTSDGPNNMSITVIAGVFMICIGAYYAITSENPKTESRQEAVVVEVPDPAPAEPLPTEVDLPEPETAVTPPVEATSSPAPEEPQTEAASEEPTTPPLPKLAQSDAFVEKELESITNGMSVSSLLVPENIARQFVVFVDNLAQGELARKVSPMAGPKQKFTVADITNKTYLNPDSFHRYDIYADLLAGIDLNALANSYVTIAPLLDEAYAELGYGDVLFAQRLEQAIEVMLDAPIIEDPIELDGVSVNYQFVDPALEALPSAQKLMLRMGPDNARKVKASLRQIRNVITNP
ncbi:DUF3014 domain-containing protein [Shewanella gelidii]|uniref:DUF3014 domain-containing protein n=1 Tax=Shewanella gelidii TaxID=1642821 RepID=A0A917JRN0_9GAMM|nr:DUF3014 domain-containing protein [Shewanella gelidii]MCL1098440.1 DUF3014 domain-containing protein [Shewanella gelidii]GGI82723.1 hypothetical protein GCM10009332_19980 [Shewanella gelidii]